jgi:DNA-binding response OmpR family regulator
MRIFSAASKKHECDILPANNGEQALRLLREHKVSVALLDLVLPDANGIDLLKKSRLCSLSAWLL